VNERESAWRTHAHGARELAVRALPHAKLHAVLAGAAHRDSVEPEEDDEPGLPVVGEVVAGKYLIERRLGSGGMGIVVAARNILLDDAVAIKFLRPSAAKDEESVHRFVREAKSARRIQSDHVVRVQDVSYLEIGTPYMIMEMLEGEDLGQLVESRGVLSVSAAVDLICEACSGIAEAHALGIVHRDIKPANMFLARRHDGSRVVKVLDFGISKAMDDGASPDPNMTDTRATFGSPTYMSPEQIRSSKKVDFRTDIWALGVCLHEVLTARPPFLAETVAGLLASIIADAPVPIRQERPDIPAGLESAILKCLEKDLSRRFQTIGDLVAALRPFASAGAETSIKRVLRLSPPSYLRSPSISAEGMGDALSVSDSYRSIGSSPASQEAVSQSTGAPSYGQMRADSSSSAAASARSDAAIVHARTERNFTTSSNVAAPRGAAPSSGRRTGIAVAALLGALSVTGVGVVVTRLRHRDVIDPARSNETAGAAGTGAASGSVDSGAGGGSAITPVPETTGAIGVSIVASPPAPATPVTPASAPPAPPIPPATVTPESSKPPVASLHPPPAPVPRNTPRGKAARPPVVGVPGLASPPPTSPEQPASTPPVKPSKDGTMNEQF
jgi:serine/threonine protein kinase